MLLEYSQQIALGAGYLADRKFIHRDLAARNVLVSKSNMCKVSLWDHNNFDSIAAAYGAMGTSNKGHSERVIS